METLIYINGSLASVKSFRYEDNIDEADTAELTFYDKDQRFMNGGVGKGTRLELMLEQGRNRLNCGSFEVDELRCRYPPSEAVLKLNSVPSSGIRGVEDNRAWEQTNLARIARDIAGGAGLGLLYDAPTIDIKRAEQNGSGLSFLKQLCDSNSLSMKVSNNRLIIFDAEKYEKKSVAGTIEKDVTEILSYDVNASTTDIYGGAEVNFAGSGIAEWLSRMFGGGLISAKIGSGSGGVLHVNERVDSLAEAERLSKARLREKNSKEWESSLTIRGGLEYSAGNTYQLRGFGVFSGKYIARQVSHSVDGNGYRTSLRLRKVM